MNISNQIFNLYFNHIVEKFYIYFEDMVYKLIYKLRVFDKIKFIANKN